MSIDPYYQNQNERVLKAIEENDARIASLMNRLEKVRGTPEETEIQLEITRLMGYNDDLHSRLVRG
jgi:uncharacterized protein Yka (UPF0111/DUF47 family)